MTTSDDCAPVPDTAMATGNDDGDPGPAPGGPLAPDEAALLEQLRREQGAAVIDEAAEDSPEVVRAMEDDSVVPPD
jgi:hypothetical protein